MNSTGTHINMAGSGLNYLTFIGATVWNSLHFHALSDKHPGPIVRIGPNEIHIEDSEYFDTIFGFRPLNKEAMTAKEFGINHALFGVEDYKTYVKKRAAFGNAFSRTKLSKIQDQINEEIQKGCTWIEDNSKNEGPVDLAYVYPNLQEESLTSCKLLVSGCSSRNHNQIPFRSRIWVSARCSDHQEPLR
jgi:hypothetical protein